MRGPTTMVNNKQGDVICVLCYSTAAAAKISNLKGHYESKHKDFQSIVGEERTAKIPSLVRSFNQQQKVFTMLSVEFEPLCEVSYDISLMIAESGRPLFDGDYLKNSMKAASKKLCPYDTNKLF
ncbi:hypothetical protein RF11_12437 [Thelohanellus kitauei]|uniref:Uncharacterized protein n=1 Tax=Thelohanellus kitauei TaxID=669202 RepID=A0A0C2JQW1_THEKT|nr:hypothetical protein RF11_12437 [Thelohanellus kitauei]